MFITLEKGTPHYIANHKTTPDIFKPLNDRIEVMTWEIKAGSSKMEPKVLVHSEHIPLSELRIVDFENAAVP